MYKFSGAIFHGHILSFCVTLDCYYQMHSRPVLAHLYHFSSQVLFSYWPVNEYHLPSASYVWTSPSDSSVLNIQLPLSFLVDVDAVLIHPYLFLLCLVLWPTPPLVLTPPTDPPSILTVKMLCVVRSSSCRPWPHNLPKVEVVNESRVRDICGYMPSGHRWAQKPLRYYFIT